MVRNIYKELEEKKRVLELKLKEVKAIREEIKNLRYNTLPTKEELEEIFSMVKPEIEGDKKFITKPVNKIWRKAKEFFPAVSAHDVTKIMPLRVKNIYLKNKVVRGVEL